MTYNTYYYIFRSDYDILNIYTPNSFSLFEPGYIMKKQNNTNGVIIIIFNQNIYYLFIYIIHISIYYDYNARITMYMIIIYLNYINTTMKSIKHINTVSTTTFNQ